jgi:hypothetical protein
VRSYNPRVAHDIDTRLADWGARLDRLEAGAPAPRDVPVSGDHLLFVPSPSGYELVERVGDSPSVGELLELEGRRGRYAVMRIVRSPLPGDGRRCAYLEPI